MKKQRPKYFIVLLLIVLFAAPGVSAYLFYQHPDWLSSATVNKGTLLTPPIALNEFGKKNKWRIVFMNPGLCEQACLKQLDLLARVRLALGRKLYQVDQFLVIGETMADLSHEAKAILKDQDFQIIQLPASVLAKLTNDASAAKIYIVNPENYLILSYQAQVNPNDIYQDLKLLLNTTDKKSG